MTRSHLPSTAASAASRPVTFAWMSLRIRYLMASVSLGAERRIIDDTRLNCTQRGYLEAAHFRKFASIGVRSKRLPFAGGAWVTCGRERQSAFRLDRARHCSA